MHFDGLGLPAGASVAVFWPLWGILQTLLAVLASRLVVFGSLRAEPDRFLARIRRSVQRGDWDQVEATCRRDGGPFAQLTLIYSTGRGLSQSCRTQSLDLGIGALTANVNARVRLVLLIGFCALAAGLVEGGLALLYDLTRFAGASGGGDLFDAARRVVWPIVLGLSVFLACYGTCGLVREHLRRLALDLDLVLALLELWSRPGGQRGATTPSRFSGEVHASSDN